MASISTYAKLIKPAMFNPADGGDVTFRFECSEDLHLHNVDLVVFGNYNANGLHGTRVLGTQSITEGVSGVMLVDFVVPATSLGNAPTAEQEAESHMSLGGKMKAVAVVYDGSYNFTTNEGVIFKSNEIYVDMLIMFKSDFKMYTGDGAAPYTTGSRYTAQIYYRSRNAFGSAGSTDAASYRFFLYDKHKQLIKDSGEMHNWNTVMGSAEVSPGYIFDDLRDGEQYYITAKATLNGGYTLYKSYEPLTVEYADVPSLSQNLKLANVIGGVKCELNLTGVNYSHVKISRTEVNVNEYITLRDIYKSEDEQSVSYTDGYVIPKRKYIYRAEIYNGDIKLYTLYNIIEYTSNCITISDVLGTYYAVGNISKAPINRNSRGGTAEAMDNRYPFYTLNSIADYESGTASGLFSEVEDCAPRTNNAHLSKFLRAWLNNGHAKILTYYTGEAWIVSVSNVSTSDPNNDDAYETSFEWTQIGNIENIEDYVELGLVTDYQGGDVV